MYDRFICVDGKEVKLEDCLNKCRMEDKLAAGRCLSERTLGAIAEQRVWEGTPSTTMLLRGTREVWLGINNLYAIPPHSKIYALNGTRVHAMLDLYTPSDSLSEIRLFDDNSSGAFDFYRNGVLYDNKNYASFAVAKTLGLYEVEVQNGVYKTTKPGKYKAGDPKFKKVIRNDGYKSRFDLAVQLNDYRMKLEKSGYPVSKMVCEILVRDGGSWMALKRGVDFLARLVVVNKISDTWVTRYMTKKATDLQSYLSRNVMPPICKPRERWFNSAKGTSMKCHYYCDVRYLCDYGLREMNLKVEGSDYGF